MPLFFVTGTAATGKSAVCTELKHRGYAAFDTDEDGFAKWHNGQTGYIHPKSTVKEHHRTPDFLAVHTWQVAVEDVRRLAEEYAEAPVFLCGFARNYQDLAPYCRGVIALYADDETVGHRLANRGGNAWGKQPHEREKTLAENAHMQEVYKNLGYTMVDAGRPLNEVVDDVLGQCL